jgi:hypothetical protein
MSEITEQAVCSVEPPKEPPEKKKLDLAPFKYPLLPSEEKLLENIRADRVSYFADARPRDKDKSAAIITAEFLSDLIKRIARGAEPKPSEINIQGACIVGKLDLRFVAIDVALVLKSCQIPEGLELSDARTKLLVLDDSWIGEVTAPRLRIDGSIMMREGFRALGPVVLDGSHIEGSVELRNGRFYASHGRALSCRSLETGGAIIATGTRARGMIDFRSAKIGGDFVISSARLACRGAIAMDLSGARFDGSVILSRSVLLGDLDLTACKIVQDLGAEGTVVRAERSFAIQADKANVGGAVNLRWGFRALGRVRFLTATIGGVFDCEAATFKAKSPRRLSGPTPVDVEINSGWAALNLEGARVGAFIIMRRGWVPGMRRPVRFSASGGVVLTLAKVGLGVVVANATLNGERRSALDLARIEVGNDFEISGVRVLCRAGIAINLFNANLGKSLRLRRSICLGDLDLTACKIVQDLVIERTVVRAERSFAIQASGANIGGTVYLRWGFRALGRVRFLTATIGGAFYCEATTFEATLPRRPSDPVPANVETNVDWAALNLDGARVGAYLIMRGAMVPGMQNLVPFSATGGVVLTLVRVGLGIQVRDATLDGQRRPALDLTGAETGILQFRSASLRGDLILRGTKVQRFQDEKGSWPEPGCITLDGFQYARFEEAPADAKSRIDWLKKQPDQHLKEDFKPQPWEQTVQVLRAMGNDADAKKVAVEKRNLFLASGQIDRIRYWGTLFLKWTARYGYSPHRLVVIMAVICLCFSGLYWWAASEGVFAPTSIPLVTTINFTKDCHRNWWKCDKLPAAYSTFNPLVYAIENSLPVIDFGQRKDWAPMTRQDDGSEWIKGSLIRKAAWFHVFLGWVGSLLLAGILSGLVKRE